MLWLIFFFSIDFLYLNRVMKKLCERHPSIHRHVTIPKRGKSKTAHPWKWIRLQLAVHNDPEAFPHERTTGNVALEMWNGFMRQGWWRGGRRFRGSSRSVIGSIQRMSRPLTRDSSPSPSPGLPSPAIVDAQCPTLYSSSTPLLGYNTLLLELGLFLPPRCVTQSREGRFFGSFKCLSSGVVAIQLVECELFFGFWCVILDLECLRAGGFLGVVMIFGRSDVGGCRWRSLSILVVCILYVVRCSLSVFRYSVLGCPRSISGWFCILFADWRVFQTSSRFDACFSMCCDIGLQAWCSGSLFGAMKYDLDYPELQIWCANILLAGVAYTPVHVSQMLWRNWCVTSIRFDQYTSQDCIWLWAYRRMFWLRWLCAEDCM